MQKLSLLELEKKLMQHDDSTARAHLDAGFPIYYMEENTPENLIVKEYPSGRRQWIPPSTRGHADVAVPALVPAAP